MWLGVRDGWRGVGFRAFSNSLRVQVPSNHILTQNHNYNYYYPNPKYLITGYMDPYGMLLIILKGFSFKAMLHESMLYVYMYIYIHVSVEMGELPP